MRQFITLLSLLFVLGSCAQNQVPKTIYVVRHAEKQLTGENPPLSQTGELRAKKLAQILADKNIQHVFSTDYIRTRSTVEPTAQAAGLTIEQYDPKNHDSLVQILREREGNILVVGHSNTINQLANYFVGEFPKFDDLTDLEYDFIFEITLEKNSSSVTRKLYKDF
jgi:broad specificity phosphatase PhoE